MPHLLYMDEPIETPHLQIRNAEVSDLSALETLCTKWTDKELVEGHSFSKDYIDDTFNHKDLPPIENASKEAHKLKTITLKNSGEIVGFIELYHGYRHDQMLWFGMFLMDPSHQKQGYGGEVIQGITREAAEKNYTHMGIGVYLKNWKSLRFWYQNGFNKIIGIYGDKEYSQETFALMGLEKCIAI